MYALFLMVLFVAVLASMVATGDELERSPAQFAALDGFRVYYKRFGQGTTAVVLVHGFGCDLTTWRSQVPAFADKTHLLLIDLPGHGASDKPDIPFSMDLFARAIHAVLTAAGAERAVVVGHSMGTMVARQFWRLFPEKTVALVAVDGMLVPLPPPPGMNIDDQRSAADRRFAEIQANSLRFVDMTTANLPADVRQSIRQSVASVPEHALRATMRAMADPAIWNSDRINVPVQMILCGVPIWPIDYEAQVRAVAPQLEFHRIKGMGHFLILQDPAAFNALLGDFLKRQAVIA